MFDSLKYFNIYNLERNLSKEKLSFTFWDAVVLTAADVYQKEIFEKQISEKIQSNLIPKNVFYHVFSDPPESKIGCGGATMHTISELYELHKNNLIKMRILIINAGGYSQRLPSASVLGKVFTPFPFGDPAWNLFDAKLASYIPFIQRMNPGYFIAASDTIELYNLDGACEYNEWNFCKSGFTAIAHPSSLNIGTMHGVYVLDTGDNRDNKLFKKCLKVLQKPSIEDMKLSGAIVKNADIYDGEFVYTDSCFYFDHIVGKKLLSFYDLHKPLECEIDAYGDFLKCPGSCSFENSFQSNLLNCETLTYIKRLYKLLHEEILNVITLDKSEFLHFGSMKEYIVNFSRQSTLYKSLKWQNSLNSYIKTNDANNGTMLYSYFAANSQIGNNSIVEYCTSIHPIIIGENCILNHCSNGTGVLRVPDNLFLHTISLSKDSLPNAASNSLYVTLIYGIDDDVKRKVDNSSTIFNKVPLAQVFKKIPKKIFYIDKSLWQLKIYPVEPSMSQSLISSMRLLPDKDSNDSDLFTEDTDFISSEDALKFKSSTDMLEYRRTLVNLINTENLD